MSALVNIYPPEVIRKRVITFITTVTPPPFDQSKFDLITKLFSKTLTGRPGWDPSHAGITLGWLMLPDTAVLCPILPDALNSVQIEALCLWCGVPERDTVKAGFDLELHQVCTRAIYDYHRTQAFAALKRPNTLGVIIDAVNADLGPVQMETDSILASTIRAGGIMTDDHIQDKPMPPKLAGFSSLGKVASDIAKTVKTVQAPAQNDLPDIDNVAPPAQPKSPKKQLFYLK